MQQKNQILIPHITFYYYFVFQSVNYVFFIIYLKIIKKHYGIEILNLYNFHQLNYKFHKED